MKLLAAAAFAALAIPYAFAQGNCRGTALIGAVHDSTLAIIPGAELTLDGVASSEISDADGSFRIPCVAAGQHHLTVTAVGFAKQEISFTAPHAVGLDVVLKPEEVQTQLDVDSNDSAAPSTNSSGPSQTLSGNRLQSLADDPDDLQRQLQQLAAAAGGNPANATIAVDGFQDSSKLPPKSTIAYIKVNPDTFSAEYREPPFGGGRVEVYTKPGQSTVHGALFLTNSSPWENSRDPFSTSKAAIGKQRYGFELTGPLHKGSDFVMALEHRSIDNFAVVNAITLDSSARPVSTITNVATPQRLWIGSAKVNWQLTPKNTFMVSYNANVNHLQGVGAGGSALPDTAYDSQQYEHMLRFSNVTTASAHLMHEARVSLRWDGETDNPVSIAPSVQVAGAFTGGGATLGPQRLREFNVEALDDAILTTKNHTLKMGFQLWLYHEQQKLTNNFNGTYTFGGGTAPALDADNQPIPGVTATISGLEQYRRSVLGLPGGAATAYSNVAGSPAVNFNLVQNAVFIQDDWNVGHGLHVASGVRYFWQNNPSIYGSLVPRLGLLWSPTKKGTWTLHGHAGLFSGRYGKSDQSEIQRMDGIQRVTSTIYNATYGDPFNGVTPIHSIRRYAPNLGNLTWFAWNIGGTRSLTHGWTLSADYVVGRIWNYTRSNNINSPLTDSPYGPRPGPSNLNILEMQNSGQGRVNATFAGLEQHSLKWLQIFFGGVRVNLIDDTDDNDFFTPQSSRSDVGEFARRTGQPMWNIFGNFTLTLPRKIQLSGDFHGGGGAAYNITTGFDNNGDGNFNDRPQYAPVGLTDGIGTPWGSLVSSGGTGVFPRNKGVMPWTYYFDTNLQRAFSLTHNAKPEHPQTITVNLRSANVLNHLNVKQVGGVLGSPMFLRPFAADNGRRIEAGLRYSF